MSDPLRIALFVHHQLTTGTGAAGSTLHLADALRARGHHVDVIGAELVGKQESLATQLRFPFAAASRVRRALRQNDYDIIDATTGDLWTLTSREIRGNRAVIVTRSHGLEPLGVAARREGAARGEITLRRRYGLYHGGWRLHEVRRTLRLADLLLVLNQRERDYAEAIGVSPAAIAVTAPLMGSAYASEVDATTEARVLVTGGLQWRKGGFDNAHVVREIVLRHPQAHVTWLGVTQSDLEGLLTPLERTNVRALPSFSDGEASLLFASHRVVVHLSRFEGWGMLVVEALSHGCLIVGTNTGVVGDVIADSGWTVAVGDRDAACRAVDAALTARDLEERRERAAQAARRYEPSRVVTLLEENYREALRTKRGRATHEVAP